MSGSSVYGWWQGRTDEHTSIVSYEGCVDSARLQCDVLPSINLTSTNHTFELGDLLEHN